MSFVAPHGLKRTTGPNQLLGSAPNGEMISYDLTNFPVGSFLGRTVDGLGILTATSGTSPFGDGSLAAPSITFASDLGLGFFLIGADIIGGATAGVLGFRYGGASQTAVLGSGAFAARTAGTGGTAVGHGAGAALTNTANVTALGANANASLSSANGSTSVGSNSQATTDATSLGFGALALGLRGVAIGAGAGGGTGTQGADNVVIGPFAFDGNKKNSPTGVVAIGLNALGGDLTVGACNSTAVGSGALVLQTDGSRNTAVGFDAGATLTTGEGNTFIGASAGGTAAANTTNCVCIGATASTASSGQDGCIVIGEASVSFDSSSNIVIGQVGSVSGNGSIVIGDSAGSAGMGADNIAIGRDALDGAKTNAVTGIVAIGVNALGSNLTGVAAVNSVAIGSSALAAQSSGVNNTAVGNLAGSILSIGSSNAFFGRSAGANVQSGSSNVYIGSTADTSASFGGASNNVGIGAASFTLGLSAVGIGASSTTSADNTVVIGANAVGSAAGNIIVGQSAGSTGMGINNIAIGIDCLDGTKSNSPTGIVAIGPLAMRGAINVAACNSTAIGFSALTAQIGGSANTAVGFGAGSAITSGANCVFVGANADGAATVSGQIALGSGASTAGDSSIVIGTSALSSGSQSVSIGANTSASFHLVTVIGDSSTVSGQGSIVIGQSAGSAGMGTNNIAIGTDCLDGAKTNSPTGIVAIGPLAMQGAVNVAASNCTAVGFSALNTVTGGTNNTAVGHNACSAKLTTGSNNTLLGSGTSVDAAGRLGTVVLGQGAAGTADNGLFFRTATLAQTGGLPMRFDTANGRAGPDTSSIRYKTDVTLAPYDGSLTKLTAIDKIRVIEFKSKTAEHDDPILGVIAEEAAEHVHPSLIARDDRNDIVGIDYSHLSCMLLQEIQFLRREVAKLRLNPLPALPAYVPVREEDIYPPKRSGDDNLMAAQKAQGKEARKNRKASHAADDIEDEPDKEAEIMATYNPEMQSRIRAEQERRAIKAAEEEEAERQRLENERLAAEEAEAKEAEEEPEAKEE